MSEEKLKYEELKATILGGLDALEAMIGKFREELSDKPKQAPQEVVTYDIEKIEWKDMQDSGKGPWQLSKDVTNPNYIALQKVIESSIGGVRTKTHFVWKMEDALGRKLLKDCKRKK